MNTTPPSTVSRDQEDDDWAELVASTDFHTQQRSPLHAPLFHHGTHSTTSGPLPTGITTTEHYSLPPVNRRRGAERSDQAGPTDRVVGRARDKLQALVYGIRSLEQGAGKRCSESCVRETWGGGRGGAPDPWRESADHCPVSDPRPVSDGPLNLIQGPGDAPPSPHIDTEWTVQ